MPLPTPQDVHIDVALSNISVAYRNKQYIADQLFPLVPSDKQSNKYFKWTKDFWFRVGVQRRGPGGVYEESSLDVSNTQFFCNDYSLAYPIPDEVRANADAAIDAERAGAEHLADQFMLKREDKFSGDFFKTTIWGTDVTLNAASSPYQWNDYGNSDPVGDVQKGISQILSVTGQTPNSLTVGRQVWEKLRDHPTLVERYKYTQKGILTEDLVAAVLGVDRLLVGTAVKNTAAEGAAFVGAYIWGKSAMLLYTPPAPGIMVPSAGYTFVWDFGGTGLQIGIRRIRDEMRRRDVLAGDQYWAQATVGTDLGYFFATAVA